MRRASRMLDEKFSEHDSFRSSCGGIAQLVERLVRNEKARGSNPLTSSPERLRGCRAVVPRLRDEGGHVSLATSTRRASTRHADVIATFFYVYVL